MWLRGRRRRLCGCCPSRPIPEDLAGFKEPKNGGHIGGFAWSRPRSRRLGPPPGSVRGAWRALGDGSHIEIVTSGTDAEDGMDYQRRRAERAGGWRGRVMNPEPPNARPVNPGEPDRECLHGQRIHGRLRIEAVRRYRLPTLDICERIRELVRMAADVRWDFLIDRGGGGRETVGPDLTPGPTTESHLSPVPPLQRPSVPGAPLGRP